MNKTKKILLLVLVMFLWGSLAPFTKAGYEAFRIDTSYIPNVILFAGLRFTICGAVITAISAATRGNARAVSRRDLWLVLLAGLFSIVLHYGCNYIGLTTTDSSAAVLLKQLCVFVFIPISFLFFREDRFTLHKLLGAVCGLSGVIVLNWNPAGVGIGRGELFIIAASFSLVVSSVISKKAMRTVAPLTMTGYSQLFGGVVLLVAGLAGGGAIRYISLSAGLLFLYICAASIVSYCLWYWILSGNNLSELFIIKFLEPVFAGLFGAILLHENVFRPEFLAALLLTGIAIFFSQR
nr:DMT family transporter [uncultured Oscillibacter sp.]